MTHLFAHPPSTPAIQADISSAVRDSKALGDAEKREIMPGKVDAWVQRLKALQEQSASASMFLAKYDVRQAEARITTVREALDDARAVVSQVQHIALPVVLA